MHARVVCGYYYKSSVDAVIGCSKDGICRHIYAYVLHGRKAAHSGDTRAVRHLHRYFLVGRPFTIQIIPIFGQVFKHLGAGRARICGAYLYPGFIRAPGYCLISIK